jgi:hypothetical protein
MAYNNIQKNDDHVYYNVIITNTSEVRIPAQYFETRSDPIIPNCEDYHMSIIKFTIPTEQLPIISDWYNGTGASATYNQENGYSVTLLGTGGATASQQFIQWQPIASNSSSGIPILEQLIFNYQQLVNMINTAFQAAYTAIGGKNTPPFISFDPALQLFIIYINSADLAVKGATPAISIYFNVNLALLFPSFPYVNYNGVNYSYNHLGEYAQIPTVGTNTLSSTLLQMGIPGFTGAGGTGYGSVAQEYPATVALFEPRSLRFISGSVPSKRELVPQVNFNLNSNPFAPAGPPSPFPIQYSGSNLGGDPTQAILTDFDLPLSNSVAELKPFVQYVPTAQYRYLDLQTQGPLNQFDLTIYWVDELGGIHPLYLNPNQSATIKILFQRKW